MTDSTYQRRPWVVDLLLVAVWTGVAAVVFLGDGGSGWPAVVVGVPLLVFLPGYAAVSALFPAEPVADPDEGLFSVGGKTTWPGRFAMSIAASPALVAVVGFVLATTIGIARTPAVVGIVSLTVVLTAIALVRRARLDPRHRAAPTRSIVPVIGDFLGKSEFQRVVTVVALVVFLLAVVSVGLTPADHISHSEVALLSENETGDLVAAEYRTTYAAGAEAPHVVAVYNHEGQETTYGVVTVVESVDAEGTVTASQRLDATTVTVPPDDRAVLERTIAPSVTGTDLRLRTFVYRGGIPETPRPEAADYTVRRWIAVTGGADAV